MVKKFPFLFILFLICGCYTAKKNLPPHLYPDIPVVSGSVINHAAFERAGTLSLGVFKPGPGAAANEETDRLSSMVVKGIKDTLLEEKNRFTIVEDDQKNADFLLEGYIEDYNHKGRFSHLSLEGEIWMQETGEKILLFQTSGMINVKTQDPMLIAYQMGVAIAHFIGKDHRS